MSRQNDCASEFEESMNAYLRSTANDSPWTDVNTPKNIQVPTTVDPAEIATVQAVEDARYLCPSSWEEADMIHTALAPSFRDFQHHTGHTYTENNSWYSYATQWTELQQHFASVWKNEGRREQPPLLIALHAWPGTIMHVKEVPDFQTRFRPGDEQPLVRYTREPAAYSLLWYEKYRVPELREKMDKEHREAATRIAIPDNNDDKTIQKTLDAIVSQDPDGYSAWLVTQAFRYYTRSYQKAMSWDVWCYSTAPFVFERVVLQSQQKPSEVRAKGTLKRFSEGSRPVISLEKAKQGYELWRAGEVDDRGERVNDVFLPVMFDMAAFEAAGRGHE